MALDITLPIAVRMAGPALFVLLAGAMVALAGAERSRAFLGVFFGGLGLSLVGANLGLAGGGAPAFYLAAAGGALCAMGFASWLIALPRETRPGTASLVALAAFVAIDIVLEIRAILALVRGNAVFSDLPADVVPSFVFYGHFASLYQAVILAAPVALAFHAARASPSERRTTAGLAAGLLVFSGFGAGSDILSGMNIGVFIEPRLALASILASAIAWLWVGERCATRAGRNVALAALAATLIGMLRHASSGYDNALDPLGASGIARLVGWAIVTVTVVRAGWLDTALLSRHRTGLAAAALAALFIVAQVAQQFLSAQYGLLMGGVVAGALLFVANPVQRAMERITDARRPPEPPSRVPTQSSGPSPATDRRVELYRRAVRFAIRDGRITPDEELHLFEVAQELGLGAGEAMRIRQDVERDARGKGGG